MPFAAWSALLAGTIAGGIALAGVLVVPREREPLVGLAGVIGLLVAVWGLATLVLSYSRPDITVATVLVGLGATAGGYRLAASLLTNLERPPATPSFDVVDTDDGLLHVVLLADAEPETYDVRATARELADLAEADAPPTPILVAPFVYAAQNTRYRAISGSSPSRALFRQLATGVASRMPKSAAVQVAWCDGPGRLPEAIAEAARAGGRRFVVAPVGVADAFVVDRVLRELDAMRPSEHGVRVVQTAPLWGSSEVTQLVVDRVVSAGSSELHTGVVLVGHGQPPEWERTHPSFDVQESAFMHRIRLLLTDEGFAEADVRVAWSDWREPGITETVRHLAALGCRSIIVSPACYPVDTIETLFDFPHAVELARADVSWKVLPGWNADPLLERSIAQQAEAAAAEISE